MAKLPTPIEPWEIPGKPKGFNVHLKRDDLTGCATSGNKVRQFCNPCYNFKHPLTEVVTTPAKTHPHL